MRYIPKKGIRKDQAPAITVPRTLTQITYLNIPLVKFLEEKGIDNLFVEVDKDEKTIMVKQAKKDQKGYHVVRTGKRGFGIAPRLRKLLPAGRYILGDKRRMIFSREG